MRGRGRRPFIRPSEKGGGGREQQRDGCRFDPSGRSYFAISIDAHDNLLISWKETLERRPLLRLDLGNFFHRKTLLLRISKRRMSLHQACRSSRVGSEPISELKGSGCPAGAWVASTVDGSILSKYTFLSVSGSSKRYTCRPTNTSDIGFLSVTSGPLLRSISGFKVYSGESREKCSWVKIHYLWEDVGAPLESNQRKVYTLLTARTPEETCKNT
jgi:hypothetical protein